MNLSVFFFFYWYIYSCGWANLRLLHLTKVLNVTTSWRKINGIAWHIDKTSFNSFLWCFD